MLALGFGFWSEWELQEKVAFNGVEKLIVVYDHVTTLDLQEDVWSAWVRWRGLQNRGYDRFLSAMDFSGYDSVPDGRGGATRTGLIYFLINGWKLVVDLSKVAIFGVLYSRDYETAYFTPALVAQKPATVSSLVNTVLSDVPVVTGDLGPTEAAIASVLTLVKYINQSVHINTDNGVNGDGSVRSPFNNIGDALDFAELVGIESVHFHSDVTIDRNFKNFIGVGVGNPSIDCAGNNLDKSEFEGVTFTGSYVGRIIARNCDLGNNLTGINGKFHYCGLGGDLFCADGGDVDMIDPFSTIEGPGRPTISLSSTVGTTLGVRGMRGGLTIKNVDHADSDVSVEMATGALTLDATCILGDIVPRGSCDFVDSSNGSIVDKSGLDSEQVWKGLQL